MRETVLIGAGALVTVIIAAFAAVYLGPVVLVALFGAIGLALILRRPWLGIAVLIVYLPMNSMVSSLLGEGAAALVFGGVKDAILLVLLVVVLLSKSTLSRVSPSTVILVIFIMLLAIASSLQTPNVQQALYGIRNDYLPLLLLIVVPAILTTSTANAVAKVIAVMAQVFSLIAIYTWSLGLNWLFTLHILPVATGETFPSTFFTQGSIVPRAFSPFAGPNELAVSSVICIAVILCRSRWKPLLRLALVALPIVALVLTQSRSGLIGLALVFAVLALKWLGKTGVSSFVIGVLIAIIAGAAGFVLFTNSLFSGETIDLSAQGHALSFFESVPKLWSSFFGVGVGQVGPRAYLFMDNPLLVESYWLVLGLEAGLLVMLLYLVLMTKLVFPTLRARSLEAFTTVAVLVGALVSQIVLPTLQDSATAYLLWIAAGIGTVVAFESDSNAQVASGPSELEVVGKAPLGVSRPRA